MSLKLGYTSAPYLDLELLLAESRIVQKNDASQREFYSNEPFIKAIWEFSKENYPKLKGLMNSAKKN
jgi:hypothetical protein